MSAPSGHLSAAALAQLALGDAERIQAIYRARFVPHPQARRVLDRLNFLLDYPKCARMQCMLIYGDSGMGKTMVVEKFMRDHPETFDRASGVAHIPIVAVQMPAAPDEKRVYTKLLSAVGAPNPPNERLHRLEERALQLLKHVAPRVIIIDEVHHLLSGTAREQRRALNLLKSLANELRVCMVAIGTNDAQLAIQTDLQVASRFGPCHLPRWSATEEFRGFLAAFVRGLPLHAPSDVTDRKSVQLLLSRSGGSTPRTRFPPADQQGDRSARANRIGDRLRALRPVPRFCRLGTVGFRSVPACRARRLVLRAQLLRSRRSTAAVRPRARPVPRSRPEPMLPATAPDEKPGARGLADAR